MAPRHVPVPCSPQGKDKEETISTFYIQLQLIVISVILVSISEYHLWIIRVLSSESASVSSRLPRNQGKTKLYHPRMRVWQWCSRFWEGEVNAVPGRCSFFNSISPAVTFLQVKGTELRSLCAVFGFLFGFLGGGGHLCTSLSTQIPLLYLGSDSCLSSLLSASCCALRHCTMPDRSRQCHVSVFCSSLTLLSIMSPPKNS